MILLAPRFLAGLKALAPSGHNFVTRELEMSLHECIEKDEISSIGWRFLDTQALEESLRHALATRLRAKRFPEQDIGIFLRRDALAEPVVEGSLVIDVAILVERTSDVGGLFADVNLRPRRVLAGKKGSEKQRGMHDIHCVAPNNESCAFTMVGYQFANCRQQLSRYGYQRFVSDFGRQFNFAREFIIRNLLIVLNHRADLAPAPPGRELLLEFVSRFTGRIRSGRSRFLHRLLLRCRRR